MLLSIRIAVGVSLTIDLYTADYSKKNSYHALPILLTLIQTITYKNYLSFLFFWLIRFTHLTGKMKYFLFFCYWTVYFHLQNRKRYSQVTSFIFYWLSRFEFMDYFHCFSWNKWSYDLLKCGGIAYDFIVLLLFIIFVIWLTSLIYNMLKRQSFCFVRDFSCTWWILSIEFYFKILQFVG